VADLALDPPPAPPLAHEELELLAPVYPLPRLELASGRGTRVTDARGRGYLDFVSGIAVNPFGHGPPGLGRAVGRQLATLGHCSNLFANRPALRLAALLAEATGYARTFFCNSGAEAVEAALKFARAFARSRGRPGTDVLAFRGGFHGRTSWALAATWSPAYREPFEPLVPGVRFADFNDTAGLDAVLEGGVAAVLVEPVQGEGGAVPARREFLQALRARTAALGALLIFDEVQCGLGRCGRLLAAEHYGVRADLTLLSKALGAGVPLAAVLMTEPVAAALTPGMHGCTFGGSPTAAAAGLWVLERVRRPGFLARVRRRARRLAAGLEGLVARRRWLSATRGLGLLRAVEIEGAAPFGPQELILAAREAGLLLARGGERAVRLLPPLNVSEQELDEALALLERALERLEAGPGEAPASGRAGGEVGAADQSDVTAGGRA
jgi:predicted acetylornithine/succinylornithine family transaminase